MKRALFKKASKTYYYSTTLFPKATREDVTTLYAFVRTADDYVDAIPAQPEGFDLFEKTYRKALKGHPSHNEIIHDFVILQKRKHIKQEWVDAFFDAMRQDLSNTTCNTLKETEQYMYGSAEVIGLMMAQLLDLPPQAHKSAKLLGKAMQYINFLRDIQEDNTLGRQYIPKSILKKHGLKDLTERTAKNNTQAFIALMREEIERYRAWDDAAREGFNFIPKRYRVPIHTAADMYRWTADTIYKDPFIIYKKKVKPTKLHILTTGIKNAL